MIEPARSGEALWQDIETTQVAHGQAAIWWLGQSGYAIKTQSKLLYFDLYLSEHLTEKYAGTEKPHVRMTRAPLRGAELHAGDLAFVSHHHGDHFDPVTLRALCAAVPRIRVILPRRCVDLGIQSGLTRMVPLSGEDAIRIGGVTIYAVPSAHPNIDHDPELGHAFLGYVVDVDGVRFYHSGDTVVYPDLAKHLISLDPNWLFLPINGAVSPDTPPNMNIDDAIALAQAVGGQTPVIPMHYDMFTFNTADVRAFSERAARAGVPHHVLQCGERFIIEAKKP
jgi:L-ascorbate metabolism protein UlaG (beta-lactamase superfamily)